MADSAATKFKRAARNVLSMKKTLSLWRTDAIEQDPSTRLLLLASKAEFEYVLGILSTEPAAPGNLKLLHDDNHRTAAHHAAMHQNGEDALTQLIKKFGDCLTSPDLDKVTPLHLSARYHSAQSWENNFKAVKTVNLFRLKDAKGNTCAHWATQNKNECRMVLTVQKVDSESLCRVQCRVFWKWKNNRHETVLHYALQYCKKKVITEIMNGIGKAKDILDKKDIDRNTIAHFAAKNEINAIKLLLQVTSRSKKDWLKKTNELGETVLHLALQHNNEKVATKLIKRLEDLLPNWYKLKDKQGNTCLHALAQRPGRDAVLLEAVKAAIEQSKSDKDLTANPAAAQRPESGQKNSVLLKVVQAAINVEKSLRDKGQTADPAVAQGPESATKAAIEQNQRDKGQTADQSQTESRSNDLPDCLMEKNKHQSTVLHYAVENCSLETVRELLKKITKVENLQTADEAGNTIFHIAAKRKDKSELLEFMLPENKNEMKRTLSRRNNKSQSVLQLAIDVMDNFGSGGESAKRTFPVRLNFTNIIKEMTKDADLCRTDIRGNTLLHSLMQSQLTFDGVEQKILERFKLLVEKVDVTATNNFNLNCLHATKLDAGVLCKLLDKVASDETARSHFDKLLVNSKTGAHIIHTFSGQYKLDDQEIIKRIKRISNSPSLNSLIKMKANPESCKDCQYGETCLHFACAAGHHENIIFLLENGLSLWNESHSGQTCVDYAFENGHFYDLTLAVREYKKKQNNFQSLEATGNSKKEIKMADIWRLLDPPKRALKLPNRPAARMTLVSITNVDSTKKREDIKENTENRKQRTDQMVLMKALEMDSRKLFRAALSLNIVTRETETLFTRYLIDTLQKDERFHMHFPKWNMLNHRIHVDSTSEFALLDLAEFFQREEILPDLILTRQFELIPCCLSLLIQLEPEIVKMRAKAKGKHEQLVQLKSKITNIAVNALNELFVNADSTEIKLLFKYIKGEMKHSSLDDKEAAKKENRNCLGPKFPYRVLTDGKAGKAEQIQYGSVLDLVKKADNLDLFATDCIYSVTKEEWGKPISGCSKRGLSGNCCFPCQCCPSACSCRPTISKLTSPLARFWIHFVAFIGFLVFFGWYVINIDVTFLQLRADIVLLAYLLSFGLQEVSEIWRQRKDRENCKIGSHIVSAPAYIVDGLNIFDCSAILFLLAGLIAKWIYYGMGFKLEDAYPIQVILCVSYSFFCFRSTSFLSYFEIFGRMINMLWNLFIYDLLPFLAILLVILVSFGVFIVCLLFSNAWTPTEELATLRNGWETFIQAATLPLNLLFGNFDQIGLTYSPDSTELGKVAIKQGYEWFHYLIIFLFMGLVNVVMMNLLIALFNFRATQIYGVAIGVWRRQFCQMLEEYQQISLFPPPLSVLEYIIKFALFIFRKCSKRFRTKNEVDDENIGSSNDTKRSTWWLQDKNDYPEDYNRFLEFQAIQFRRCRSRLLRDIEWNRNDFDVVKAHTGKEVAELKADLQEMLDDAKMQGNQKYEDIIDRQEQRIESIESKLDEVLKILQPQQQIRQKTYP